MARMPTTLPTGMRAPRAGALRMPYERDQSGERAIAQTLQHVADAEMARDLQDRIERARVSQAEALTRLRAEQAERLAREGDALEEDQIDGFADRFAQGIEASASAAIEGLPEIVRNEARAEALQIGEQMRLRAVDVERTRRTERQTRALDDQLTAAGNTVYVDPTQYGTVLEQSRAAIEASGLPEGVQAARLGRLENSLAVQRFIGLARSAPVAALDELESGQWNSVFNAEQLADLQDMARRQREIVVAEAQAELAPQIDAMLNRLLTQPGRFASEMTAFRALPEIAALSTETQERVVRQVAGRAAEARLWGLINGGNPYLARQEVLGGVHGDYLSPTDTLQLMNASEAEIRSLEARRRAAAAEATRGRGAELRALMEDDIQSRLLTGRPVPVSLDEVARIHGQAAADRYAAARNAAAENFEHVRQFRHESPAQIQAHLARVRPRAGQAGFADAQERFEQLAEVAERIVTQRQQDPVQAAMDADPQLAQLMGDLANPAMRNEESRRATLGQLATRQAHLGVAPGARRVLPNAAARAYADRIGDAVPAQRASVIEEVTQELRAVYGNAAGAALAEISRVGELPQISALAPLAGDARGSRRVAQAMAAPEPQLTQAQNRAINSTIDTMLEPLRRTLANTAGGAERLSEIRAAAVRTAQADVAGGAQPGPAAQNAARLWTGQFQYREGMRAPRTWRNAPLDMSRVSRGAEMLRRELASDGSFNLPAGDPRLRGEEAERAAREGYLAGTRWITRADDRGLVLVDEFGAAVEGRTGNAISATWEELLSASRRREPQDRSFLDNLMDAGGIRQGDVQEQ